MSLQSLRPTGVSPGSMRRSVLVARHRCEELRLAGFDRYGPRRVYRSRYCGQSFSASRPRHSKRPWEPACCPRAAGPADGQQEHPRRQLVTVGVALARETGCRWTRSTRVLVHFRLCGMFLRVSRVETLTPAGDSAFLALLLMRTDFPIRRDRKLGQDPLQRSMESDSPCARNMSESPSADRHLCRQGTTSRRPRFDKATGPFFPNGC